MGFMEAVKVCFSKYVTFSGRARRSEYWWFYLFNTIVGIVLAFISEGLGNLYNVAVFLPWIAVTARRLHDVDRSGWWMLIPLVPALLLIPATIGVAFGEGSGAIAIYVLGALTIIGLIVVFVFTVMRGTTGPNRFGEDPITGSPENVF